MLNEKCLDQNSARLCLRNMGKQIYKKSFDRAIEGRLFHFLDLKLHRDQFQDVFGCIG